MTYFNLHTHTYSAHPDIIEIVNQYPLSLNDDIPYFSIGIHPWHIDLNTIEEELEIINCNILKYNCLAIGECGLDKRIETPFEEQVKVFVPQLLLAQQYSKPVIVHCVAAYQELIETVKRMNITVPVIVHGFSKNIQIAQTLLQNGFYLSFGKNLLENPELSDVLRQVPDDRFFLETDSMENGIEKVYEMAAFAKNTQVEAIADLVENNFKILFKKDF